MIGYVTIEVDGKDMDSATRHAQRLANNFINDLDTMTRNSRLADRRAMSHFETNSSRLEDVRAPSVMRTVRHSPGPMAMRLGSVQPVGFVRTSAYSNGLPPRIPSRASSVLHSYTTAHHRQPSVSEEPYYYHSTIRRVNGVGSEMPIRSSLHSPAMTNGYMTPTNNYHHLAGSRNHLVSSALTQSYSDLSRRRLDRKMDELMEYKLPSANYYLGMRGSLRDINEKMHKHKLLLDRYSGIDMHGGTDSVSDRVDQKFRELVDRMPEIEGFRTRGPSLNTSRSETNLYYKSPQTTTGYGQGLTTPSGGTTSELRGRIKRLLCRSKRDPHYYRVL